MKGLIIRSINWEDIDEQGISKDNLEVMEFFNRALKEEKYPYVPRRKNITKEEILKFWIPSSNKNITILAELNGKIVGSGTILMGNDNEYSKQHNLSAGEYAITLNPDFFCQGIGTKITCEIIKQAKIKKIPLFLHTSVENIPMVKIMKKLGYVHKKILKNYARYIDAGIHSDVYYYEI